MVFLQQEELKAYGRKELALACNSFRGFLN
jgi:hypothetical protein